MQTALIQQRLAYARQYAERLASQGGLEYLKAVVIDSRPDPLPFRLVARPWQWERAKRVVPALESIAGFRPNYSGPRSYCEVMPRGHDKTSFLARMCNWLLGFSKRKLTIIAAAGDEDQAGLILEAMQAEADEKLNPWLASRLKFRERKVFGPGGQVKVVAADAATAFGLRGDLYLLDEITHWKKSDFWVSLLSGRAKIPNAVFVILSNAGLLNTWQWDIVQLMKTDPAWCVWQAPGQLETWMSSEQIAKDRLLLPPAEARRLYDNEWIDPAEASGYLTRAEVLACEELGRQLGLTYALTAQNGKYYWLSIDYGPKRDRTTLGVYHQEPETGLIVVDRLDIWQGSPDSPVQLAKVREWIDEQRALFVDCSLVMDKYQMEDIAQHYEHHMPVERWEARGGKANYEMAACLRSVIANRQIAWYPGAGSLPVAGKIETLADELCSLVLKPMSYGYRFDHELTKHDDRAVNLGMAAVQILKQMKPPAWVGPEEVVQEAQEDEQPKDVIEALTRLRGERNRLIYGVELGQRSR